MHSARILVVEDTPMNLELATDLLSTAGFAVLTATTAEKGLSLAHTEHPDLILMDIGLPGMDGLAATRLLKSDPATRSIPIVILTAHAMQGDELRAKTAGCSGYLTKPIETRTFAARVASFLSPSPNPAGPAP